MSTLPGWPVPGTPYLIFFPANYKDGFQYREARSHNAMVEFIIGHSRSRSFLSPRAAEMFNRLVFSHPIDIPIHYMSLPVPEKNDGPVIEVVGSTFKQIVMDPNVDVYVNFYAPCTIDLRYLIIC